MKYVLVQWSSGDLKPSIVTEEYVLDKSMLNDPDREGMVVGFVEPEETSTRHEQDYQAKAFLGRVKCVSDNKGYIEQKQRLLLAEMTGTCESLRAPQQNGKRKRSECEEQCDPTSHQNLKKHVDEKAYHPDEKRRGTTSSCCKANKDEMSKLSTIVKTLERRIRRLEDDLATKEAMVDKLQKANLMLQNNLPNLILNAMKSSEVIKQLKTTCTCGCSHQTTSPVTISRDAPPLSSSVVQELNLVPDRNSPGSLEIKEETSSESHTMVGYITSNQEYRNENYATTNQNLSLSDLLNPAVLARISSMVSYKKMTTAMLLALFKKDVLAHSSVTGKSKAGRPALDRRIVELIIDYVQVSFPEASDKEIKATMAQKCKDLRNTIEKRNRLVKTTE